MKKPELLAPAGDLLKLKTAIDYGADAVYFGGKSMSLRTASLNFDYDSMAKGVDYVHSNGKKCYTALNILAHNKDLEGIYDYLDDLEQLKVDGVIVADLGLIDIIRNYKPSLNVHVSTQASVTNYATVNMLKKLGVTRVVLARELSLNEISEITKQCPDMEIECFVHGAMCMSYSGRCLLSNFMADRASNKGDCAQPCRWEYALVEAKRPGEYMPITEDERGTYIFNSKDLCMIEHVDKLIDAGISSFKIEGRVKSEYYVAAVVKAYRTAIDDYLAGKEFNPSLIDDLKKVSHRYYTTGFYFGKPDSDAQVYTTNSYVRTHTLLGIVTGYDEENKELIVSQRNKFVKGEEIEILSKFLPVSLITADYIKDDKGNEIESAPHPQMEVRIPCPFKVEPGSFIRSQKGNI